MVNKKNLKIISVITTLLVITILISLKGLITNATVASRPEFDIEFLVQDEAVVGEDIVVSGKITPKAFEISVPEKEIVFVVDIATDVSGQLVSLMSHTKKFISTIAANQKFSNVKIATIAYEQDAEIKKINNRALLDSKYENGNEIIDILKGLKKADKDAKTNTGEGLRKALYLFNSKESVKGANKTIIFISDSGPTARTLYNKNSNQNGMLYKDITSDEYINATTNNPVDFNKDLEYANAMAQMINDKGYNVFTIGYKINQKSEEASILRRIHQSMSGNDMSNSVDYEKNGFYIASDNKDVVEKMFGDIADRVLQNYSLNNIEMNLNFTGDFSLNITGNTINLSNINYELKSVSNGKARYEATPIDFQFVIKGNKEGYQQIFDKVTISYPWKNSIENVDINSELFITLKSNKLPNIEAKLISDKIVNYSENEIEVKYEIVPKDFEYVGNNNTQNKEITLIIDTSIDMKALTQLQNGIRNQIIDVFLNNNIKNKLNIITYNSEVSSYIVDPNAKDNNGVPINYQNEIRNIINNIQISNNGERKLGEAIKKADEIFSQSKDSNSLKNIIIMAAGDPTDIIPNIYKDKYNIITLAVSKNSNYNNPYTKLKEYHKLLGGKDNNYFVSSAKENNNDIESKPSNSNENPLAPNGNIMGEIVKRIDDFNTNSYKFNDITLNFDLTSNFNVISGLQLENESNYIIRLPEIVYTATNKINDNYYKYESNPIQISFKIKPEDGKTGTLNFEKNSTELKNYLSYKTLDNEVRKVGILTPTVIVKEQVKNITHGLYNGINDGQVSIQENNNGSPFEIAQGSTVTFGANFTFGGSSTEFNLNVDNKFSALNPSDIKIYKVIKDSSGDSTLQELDDNNKSISTIEGNKFKISINNMTDSSTEILVVYQGKIIDGTASRQTLTNQIVFGSTSRNATIVIPQQSTESPILPDLF